MPTDACGTTTCPILRGTLNFADEPTEVNFESPMANAALSLYAFTYISSFSHTAVYIYI